MSFHDSMLDDGYSDEEEYLEHLFDVFDKHQDEILKSATCNIFDI